MNLSTIAKKTGNSLNRNSPAILMGLSIAGVIATAWLTHKAAQKSAAQLANTVDLDPKEKIKLTWTNYIPPALSCGATIAFVIAGNTVQYKRQAALVTAVSLAEKGLNEYREQVVDTIGKGKERKIQDELIQKKVTKAEEDGKFELLNLAPDTQEQYVYDPYSDRTLVSTVEKLHKAVNETARTALDEGYVDLNDFYERIGLKSIPPGSTVGWNTKQLPELDLTSAVVKDGKGLLAIRFRPEPDSKFQLPWT